MQYIAAIQNLQTVISATARVVTRYNKPAKEESAADSQFGIPLIAREVKFVLADHHDASYYLRCFQIKGETAGVITPTGLIAKLKEEVETFREFDQLEDAMRYAGLDRKYQHALVEIIASLHGSACTDIKFGAQPSFLDPAIAIFANDGDTIVALKIEE